MTKAYWNDIENCQTLDEAIAKMMIWASDAKINTERIEVQLKNIPQGTSMIQDKHILTKQIKLVTQLLETDKRYYTSVPSLLAHAAKYHSPDMYLRMHDELQEVAHRWNDPEHLQNYVPFFLELLKKYLRLTNKKFSAHQIGTLARGLDNNRR